MHLYMYVYAHSSSGALGFISRIVGRESCKGELVAPAQFESSNNKAESSAPKIKAGLASRDEWKSWFAMLAIVDDNDDVWGD